MNATSEFDPSIPASPLHYACHSGGMETGGLRGCRPITGRKLPRSSSKKIVKRAEISAPPIAGIKQNLALTAEQRIQIAHALRRRAYPSDAKDVRYCQPIFELNRGNEDDDDEEEEMRICFLFSFALSYAAS